MNQCSLRCNFNTGWVHSKATKTLKCEHLFSVTNKAMSITSFKGAFLCQKKQRESNPHSSHILYCWSFSIFQRGKKTLESFWNSLTNISSYCFLHRKKKKSFKFEIKIRDYLWEELFTKDLQIDLSEYLKCLNFHPILGIRMMLLYRRRIDSLWLLIFLVCTLKTMTI